MPVRQGQTPGFPGECRSAQCTDGRCSVSSFASACCILARARRGFAYCRAVALMGIVFVPSSGKDRPQLLVKLDAKGRRVALESSDVESFSAHVAKHVAQIVLTLAVGQLDQACRGIFAEDELPECSLAAVAPAHPGALDADPQLRREVELLATRRGW